MAKVKIEIPKGKNIADLTLALFAIDISSIIGGYIPKEYAEHSRVMKELIKKFPAPLKKELEGIISVTDEEVKYISARKEVEKLELGYRARLKKLFKFYYTL
jgi:RNase H-fold protein (predicted Holliday junction resolvase)